MNGTAERIWPQTPNWLKKIQPGRESFLSAVPSSLHATTCRCTTKASRGWKIDHDRNMWVCSECEKPSPAHQGYNIFCIWCEEWFTIWQFGATDNDPIEVRHAAFQAAAKLSCSDCGGDNDARKYHQVLF